jgi:SAM-dependent methyltransferase
MTNREILKARRRDFLDTMLREAMKAYEHPGEEWSEDEKEFLPLFVGMVKPKDLILDLGGGYGRVTAYLLRVDSRVVIADLSIHSLRMAKKTLRENVDFIQLDSLSLPFIENAFEAVWFTQAFEYVPPDLREPFLLSLRKTIKEGGIMFMNIAKVPNECSFFSYVKNFFYWRLIRRQPVLWGDYIYKLDLEHYKGWHYHSVVFNQRAVQRIMKEAGFEVFKTKTYRKGYVAYLLRAS